jgi:hypothetical protein
MLDCPLVKSANMHHITVEHNTLLAIFFTVNMMFSNSDTYLAVLQAASKKSSKETGAQLSSKRT